MKFSHIADVHIGAWRDPKMKFLGEEAFIKSIEESIKENVDFVLIAGDLFNTAIPGIDQIKLVIKKLKELKNKGIPLYYIAGSHDYSPSGKTMLDIIEEADLGINVTKGEITETGKLKLKFTKDQKTGAKITGLIGRRGMLERKYYEALDQEHLEKEEGFKIFMFHTALDELKPKELKEMESSPISFLPKDFDYYAGGHVHIVTEHSEKLAEHGYKYVIYPGPTFPANFSELEKLETGGFYIYDKGKLIRKELDIKKVETIKINIENKTAEEAKEIIKENMPESPKDKIILVRVQGTLSSGTPTQIDFKTIIDELYKKGACFVMKNTTKLHSKEFQEIKTETTTNEELESKLIKEHLGQTKNEFEDEEKTTKELMHILSLEKNEGEKQSDYEERIRHETEEIINKQK